MPFARLDVIVRLTDSTGSQVLVPNCDVQIFYFRRPDKHTHLLASRLTGSFGPGTQGIASFYLPVDPAKPIAIRAALPGVIGELPLPGGFDGVPTPPSTTVQTQNLLLNRPSAALGTRADLTVTVNPPNNTGALVTVKKAGVITDQDYYNTTALLFAVSAPNWFEVTVTKPGGQPVTQNVYVQDDGADLLF